LVSVRFFVATGLESKPMKIAVIGGREASEPELVRIAEQAGYAIEFHDGHSAGRGSHAIRALVARADLTVVVTEINSHGGVITAKSAARQYGKSTFITRRFSTTQLRGLLMALERKARLGSSLLATGTHAARP
jgi:hypothetical protein